MKNKGLYTTIYPFMASVLGLSGLAKECFATIFGFWFSQDEHPVGVSLTTMQTITGGTRSAIVQAIHKLEESKLLVPIRTPGQKTMYDVAIPEQVLTDFKSLYTNALVKHNNHLKYSMHTRASEPTIPRNNIKAIHESVITPLKVKPASEIRTGGLKEV